MPACPDPYPTPPGAFLTSKNLVKRHIEGSFERKNEKVKANKGLKGLWRGGQNTVARQPSAGLLSPQD